MSDLNNSAANSEFEVYIEANKRIIYKVAASYCKNPDDRQDLVQEIIIQLWKSYDRFNSSVKISTWTYRVALNMAISFYRKDSRRKIISTELSGNLVAIIADTDSSETEQQITQLQQFINELKEVERAIMILYLEEKNQKEIGEILGITETNVSTRIGRIKEKLRKRFSLTNQ